MDDKAITAIMAVPELGSDTAKFFDLIVELYPGGQGPASLDDFVAAANEANAGLSSATEQFRDELKRQGVDGQWADIARTLAGSGGGSNLAALRDEYAMQAGEVDGADGEGGEPEPDWDGFVAGHRDFWAQWDGAGWDAWRAAFVRAGVDFGVGEDVLAQAVWLDGLEPAARLAYLRDAFGFTVDQAAIDALLTPQEAAVEGEQAGEALADAQDADIQDTDTQDTDTQDTDTQDTGVEVAPEEIEQAADGLVAATAELSIDIAPDVARQAFEDVPLAAGLSDEAIADVLRQVEAELAAG